MLSLPNHRTYDKKEERPAHAPLTILLLTILPARSRLPNTYDITHVLTYNPLTAIPITHNKPLVLDTHRNLHDNYILLLTRTAAYPSISTSQLTFLLINHSILVGESSSAILGLSTQTYNHTYNSTFHSQLSFI